MCLLVRGVATAKIITSLLRAARPSSVWLNEASAPRRSNLLHERLKPYHLRRTDCSKAERNRINDEITPSLRYCEDFREQAARQVKPE